MDINEIVQGADDDVVKEALAYFLTSYTNPVFGALPKNEVELIVLNVFERLNAISDEPEVYELVSKLRVNRTKARGLIYDRELRRSSESDLNEKVKTLLKRPIIQKDGEQFVLEIENPLVSDHLRSKVQKLGYVSDGSFSPSIVKLGLDAISALTESLLPTEEKENIREALIQAGAPNTTLRGILKATFKKIGQKVASDSGEELMDKASNYLSPIIDSGINAINEMAVSLFVNEDAQN